MEPHAAQRGLTCDPDTHPLHQGSWSVSLRVSTCFMNWSHPSFYMCD